MKGEMPDSTAEHVWNDLHSIFEAEKSIFFSYRRMWKCSQNVTAVSQMSFCKQKEVRTSRLLCRFIWILILCYTWVRKSNWIHECVAVHHTATVWPCVSLWELYNSTGYDSRLLAHSVMLLVQHVNCLWAKQFVYTIKIDPPMASFMMSMPTDRWWLCFTKLVFGCDLD